MVIDFGVYEKIFTKEALELIAKISTPYVQEAIDRWLTEEEKLDCSVRVSELSLNRIILELFSLKDNWLLGDPIGIYFDKQLVEEFS